MKRDFTLEGLLMIMAVIGIVLALFIPNAQTSIQKNRLTKDLQESMKMLSDITASTKNYISKSDIPEKDKDLILDHLGNLKAEISNMSLPESTEDIKAEIAIVASLTNAIKSPDTLIKKASSNDPELTISPLQTTEIRLARLEARLEILAEEERLNRWDVVLIVFLTLTALVAITALAKFLFPYSPKGDEKPKYQKRGAKLF
jgi:type II secretory pathway pseudopilin PulG